MPRMVSSAGFGHFKFSASPTGLFAMQPLRQGGGGFISGIDIAPDGTTVCRTDTFGAYKWNTTTLQWDQLCTTSRLPLANQGPLTNNCVYDIRVAPSNSNVMYMFYGQGNGSGNPWLFVTTDGGLHWTQMSNWTLRNANGFGGNAYRANNYKTAVDPINPDCYLITVDDGKTYETINGTSGATATFSAAIATIPTGTVNTNGCVAFDTSSGTTGGRTNVAYVASYAQGLYYRTAPTGSYTLVTGTAGMTIFNLWCSSNGTVYINTGSTGNQGATGLSRLTWSAGVGSTPTVTTITPSGFLVACIIIDPNNVNHITAFGYGAGTRDSTDAGTTWGSVNSTFTLTAADAPYLKTGQLGSQTNFGAAISWAVANPNSPGTEIICQGWQTPIRTTYPITSPQVFTTRALGIEQMAANGIVLPTNTSKAVLMQQDWGVMQSQGPNSPPTTQGYDLAQQLSSCWYGDFASDGSGVFATVMSSPDLGNADSAVSTSNGAPTWTAYAANPAASTDPYGSIAAADASHWVIMGQNDTYRTANGGASWTKIVNPGGVTITSGDGWSINAFQKRRMVAADRVNIGTFYMWNYVHGLFRSTDNGVTWTNFNNYGGSSTPSVMDPAAARGYLRSVVGQAGNLFICGSGGSGGTYSGPNTAVRLWRSTDGGQTWSIVGPSSTSTNGSIIEVWAFDTGASAPGQSYPAIYAYGWIRENGAFVQGIIRSIDNAVIWTRLTDAYPDGWCDQNFDLAADKLIYGRIYMAKAGSSFSVGQFA